MTITLRFLNKEDRYGRDLVRYDVSHTNPQGKKIRKPISTGIRLIRKDIDVRNWRVKSKNPNQKELNIALDKAKSNISKALTRFETGQFTFQQVISFLKGEVDYGSVDRYIETVIKESRTSQTYNDYSSILKAYKKHLEIPVDKEVSFQEYASYELLDKFKRNAINNGIANTTINSYFNKIRAVLNDAYDKGYIYEKFTLRRGLKLPPRPSRQIETITSEEFEKAISKADDVYGIQALALYLLMFGLRGMYNSDIVALKDAEFKHNDFDKKNPYLNIFNDGNKYIIHRRQKTKNRANDDLIIRVDFMIPFLIRVTKILFKETHKNQNILSDNPLALFDYDLSNLKLHKNIWDVYQRRIRNLLGYSFKTARKTYNTFATELEVSNTIRDILLGHQPQSINEKHYINRRTIKISEKVQEAHSEILEDFNFEMLAMKLYVETLNYLPEKNKKQVLKTLSRLKESKD